MCIAPRLSCVNGQALAQGHGGTGRSEEFVAQPALIIEPVPALSLTLQPRKQRRTQVVRSLIAEHVVGHLVHDVRQANVSGSIDYD